VASRATVREPFDLIEAGSWPAAAWSGEAAGIDVLAPAPAVVDAPAEATVVAVLVDFELLLQAVRPIKRAIVAATQDRRSVSDMCASPP
jgi:hypothetical protein